jgi:CheY-like chemotaxis protein
LTLHQKAGPSCEFAFRLAAEPMKMVPEYPSRLAPIEEECVPPVDLAKTDPTRGQPTGDRVLIVEDNWLVAIEVEAALLDAGYHVVGIAVTSEEAVVFCETGRPDFVLMDIRLQGRTDGIQAAAEIRDRFGISSIFVSAHDDPATRIRAEPAKPLGWIVKPVSGSVLVDRIKTLWRRPH